MAPRRLRIVLRALAAGTLIFPAFLSATGMAEEPEAGAPAIRISLASLPDSLHPRESLDDAYAPVMHALYDGLLRLDATGQPQAHLAAGWEHSGDGRVYTLSLREDVVFHDGTVLDSDLVLRNLQELFADPADLPLAPPVEDLRAIDAQTVQVVFTEPYGGFARDLTGTVALLVSGDDAAPVGSGRFTPAVDAPGTLDLVAVESNWTTPASVQRIRLHSQNTANGRVAALLTGERDILLDPPVAEHDFLRTRSDLRLYTGPTRVLWAIALNTRSGVLTSREVREAVSRAIDRSGLVRGLMPGTAATARLLITRSHPELRHPELRAPAWEPRRAEQILRQQGLIRAPLRVGVPASDPDELAAQVGEAVRVDLAAAGFEAVLVELNASELAAIRSSGLADELDLMLVTLPGRRPLAELGSMLHSAALPGSLNVGGYGSARVDALLADARGSVDPDEQAALIHEIQEIVIAELPWVPLVEQERSLVTRRGIAGVRIDPIAGLVLEELRRE